MGRSGGIVVLSLALGVASCGRVGYEAPAAIWSPPAEHCLPLSPPPATAIVVTPDRSDELPAIVASAPAGSTIVLDDGVYALDGGASDSIVVAQPGITIRSKSGSADAVVIDAGFVTQTVFSVEASDVTIAELTVRSAAGEGAAAAIRVLGGATEDTLRARIYRVRVVDALGASVRIGRNASAGTFADRGAIECSTLEVTDAARARSSCSSMMAISGHEARGWLVSHNLISGLTCPSQDNRAIWFTGRSRDIVIDGNVIVDAEVGIGVGYSEAPVGSVRSYADDPCEAGAYVDHIGGAICNNVVIATARHPRYDSAIGVWAACGTRVAHNTVLAAIPPQSASIEYRFASTRGVGVYNNLLPTPLLSRQDAVAEVAGNLVFTDPATIFVDHERGDFHLRDTPDNPAIGAGYAMGTCGADVDGDPRDATPDVGADELR